MNIPSTTAVRVFAIAVTTVAAVLGTATIASAGPIDDAFMADLESHGVYFDTPDWALYQANYICQEFGKGRSYTSIQREGVAQSSLSSAKITYFIERAVTTYCPVNLISLP